MNQSAYQFAAASTLALAIDLLLGEPPNRIHPVAGMGTMIAAGKRFGLKKVSGRRRSPATEFVIGFWIVVVGVGLSIVVGWCVSRWLGFIGEAIGLSCCIGVRSLATAAASVRDPLATGDLNAARQQLAYHLVSRKTGELSRSQVSAATIESVAENTSDSVVAPLLFYAAGGLPAALAYRFVNTCDAMLGYPSDELWWLGKSAARLDDVLNWIPSRITAAIMGMVSVSRRGYRVWWSDRRRTPSPNGGHPMSMAAGILNVRLEKPGVYVLGARLPEPNAADITGMLRLYWRTVIAASTLIVLSGVCWRGWS